MAWFEFFWTPEIEEHLAEHGVTVEEFEQIVCRPNNVPTATRVIGWWLKGKPGLAAGWSVSTK